jgi:hypothetical protein
MHSDHENRRGGPRWENDESERNVGSNGENGRRESNPGRDFDVDRDRARRTGGEWKEGRYGGGEEDRPGYRARGSAGNYEFPSYSASEGLGDPGHRHGEYPRTREPYNGQLNWDREEGMYGQGRAYGSSEDYGRNQPGGERSSRPMGGYASHRSGQGGYGQSAVGSPRAMRRYRGRPPKGYERSDERLKEIISERLMEDPTVDVGDVSINVTGGRVTLEGTVQSRRMKYDIEEIVEECGGKDVQNNLRIGSSPSSFSPDPNQGGSISSSSVSSSESDQTLNSRQPKKL